MTDIAVRVEGLGKEYRLGFRQKSHTTLRDAVASTLSSSFGRVSRSLRHGVSNRSGSDETVWALSDVSFEVQSGEVLAIVGANGAGKSTLLKILSRITPPTTGYAQIRGRVGSLLEVGTGFHDELTGRENIYLNGAILGMRKKAIERRFDEIVDFSGVEKFIDTPVKHYSSGMRMRLAFSVAAHLEPEVLIIDEVLAVGDAAFQQKCLGKMEGVANEGRTVLFVSHNMPAVLRLCPEAILLRDGRIVMRGPSSLVVERYLNSSGKIKSERVWRKEELPSTCGPFHPIALRVCNPDGTVSDTVRASRGFRIEMNYQLTEAIPGLRVGILLYSSVGELLLISFDTDDPERHGRWPNRPPGDYVSRCHIPANLLNKGTFIVGISASVSKVRRYFWDQYCVNFTVDESGGVAQQWTESRGGFFRPAFGWDIDRSSS
jgi:lipopolysaccharide transport system ATP-binding protein